MGCHVAAPLGLARYQERRSLFVNSNTGALQYPSNGKERKEANQSDRNNEHEDGISASGHPGNEVADVKNRLADSRKHVYQDQQFSYEGKLTE
jgi:hypothetical protein